MSTSEYSNIIPPDTGSAKSEPVGDGKVTEEKTEIETIESTTQKKTDVPKANPSKKTTKIKAKVQYKKRIVTKDDSKPPLPVHPDEARLQESFLNILTALGGAPATGGKRFSSMFGTGNSASRFGGRAPSTIQEEKANESVAVLGRGGFRREPTVVTANREVESTLKWQDSLPEAGLLSRLQPADVATQALTVREVQSQKLASDVRSLERAGNQEVRKMGNGVANAVVYLGMPPRTEINVNALGVLVKMLVASHAVDHGFTQDRWPVAPVHIVVHEFSECITPLARKNRVVIPASLDIGTARALVYALAMNEDVFQHRRPGTAGVPNAVANWYHAGMSYQRPKMPDVIGVMVHDRELWVGEAVDITWLDGLPEAIQYWIAVSSFSSQSVAWAHNTASETCHLHPPPTYVAPANAGENGWANIESHMYKMGGGGAYVRAVAADKPAPAPPAYAPFVLWPADHYHVREVEPGTAARRAALDIIAVDGAFIAAVFAGVAPVRWREVDGGFAFVFAAGAAGALAPVFVPPAWAYPAVMPVPSQEAWRRLVSLYIEPVVAGVALRGRLPFDDVHNPVNVFGAKASSGTGSFAYPGVDMYGTRLLLAGVATTVPHIGRDDAFIYDPAFTSTSYMLHCRIKHWHFMLEAYKSEIDPSCINAAIRPNWAGVWSSMPPGRVAFCSPIGYERRDYPHGGLECMELRPGQFSNDTAFAGLRPGLQWELKDRVAIVIVGQEAAADLLARVCGYFGEAFSFERVPNAIVYVPRLPFPIVGGLAARYAVTAFSVPRVAMRVGMATKQEIITNEDRGLGMLGEDNWHVSLDTM